VTDGVATIHYLTTALFGHGASGLLADVLAEIGVARPFVVTDPGVRVAGVADGVISRLPRAADVCWFDTTPANPTDAAIEEATEALRAGGCDGVVAIGGGSSIDLAKGVAMLASHGGRFADYALTPEGGARITAAVLPNVAIPTTAGTGSEVGRAAVIKVDGRKRDVISPHLFPTRAICDPELTLGLPALLTAATGMDALTHCIETFLSPLVNPPAEAIALDGVRRAAGWIGTATSDGGDREARWQMMMASMEGALTFQKGLGAVHAMAHPLGALDTLSLHHGTLNAVLLPAVLRFNEVAAAEKVARLREAFGLPAESDLAGHVAGLNRRLGLPAGLAAMGVTPDMIPRIAEHAADDGSTLTNPRPAGRAEYAALLLESMGPTG
jgi:alcohol dehydrogenase class IV